MKYIYFFVALFVFALTGQASTVKQSSESQNSSEQKAVIIRLKKQFDAPAYVQKNLAGYSTEVKRSRLIGSLKKFNSQSQESLLTSLKAEEQKQEVSNIKTFWLANVVSCKATNTVIEKLRAREDVESVSFDIKEKIIESETSEQTNALATTTAANIEMVRALEANEYGYTGKGVLVGVIDTGVNPNHEDIKDALWTTDEYPNHGWNFIENNDKTMDEMGHGTHCAGTILGNGTSGTRTGVAPDANLMVLRVTDSQGGGSQTGVWDAVQFAAEHGAKIISMSLGFVGTSNNDKKTWRDIMTNLLQFNTLAVVAAGNEGNKMSAYPLPNNVRVPGICPAAWLHPEQTTTGSTSSVITIGAVTTTGKSKLAMSSVGPTTWQDVDTYEDFLYKPEIGLIKPDIVAPGDKVVSLNYANTTGYTTMTGTSMATPCVAGIAAVMLSKNPNLTPAEIVRILSESTIKLNNKQFNNQTGAGRADALLAALYTPNVGMNCASISFEKTAGYTNDQLDPGDEANISLSFKNELNEDISNYQISIKSVCAQAVVQNHEIVLPTLKAGESTQVDSICSIRILSDAKVNDLIDIAVEVRKGEEVWTNLFRLPVGLPTNISHIQTDALHVSCFKSNNNCVVQISAPDSAPAIISLYNSNGQLIHQSQENASENTTISIPVSNYKGIHFIRVNVGGETIAKKILL